MLKSPRRELARAITARKHAREKVLDEFSPRSLSLSRIYIRVGSGSRVRCIFGGGG